MNKLEKHQLENSDGLTQEIQDFWSRNVNAERLMGESVSEASRGDPQYFSDLERQRYRSHYHLLPWIKRMQPGREVLEIGCGIGLDSYTMATNGLKLTAMDLTHVGVNTARRRFAANKLSGEFLVGDACDLPFSSDQFDYLYSFGVLHHAADTEQTIKEVYRVLKPGGTAYIMLYHRHSLNEWVHRLTRIPFEDRDESCPVVRRYSKVEIRRIFAEFCDLDIEVEYLFGEGYGRLFKLTPGWIYKPLSRIMGWHLMITAIK